MSSDASVEGWSLPGAFWPREVVSSVDTPQYVHDSADARRPTLEITRFGPPSLNLSTCIPSTCGLRKRTRQTSCRWKIRISERARSMFEANAARCSEMGTLPVLESSALHEAQPRVYHSSHEISVRQLYLVDNMGVASAFERPRAHVHRLLAHARRFAALCACAVPCL